MFSLKMFLSKAESIKYWSFILLLSVKQPNKIQAYTSAVDRSTAIMLVLKVMTCPHE